MLTRQNDISRAVCGCGGSALYAAAQTAMECFHSGEYPDAVSQDGGLIPVPNSV